MSSTLVKLDNESEHDFEMYCYYAKMGLWRSVYQVAKYFDVEVDRVESLYLTNNWALRVYDYDIEFIKSSNKFNIEASKKQEQKTSKRQPFKPKLI